MKSSMDATKNVGWTQVLPKGKAVSGSYLQFSA